ANFTASVTVSISDSDEMLGRSEILGG
ncbi:hypothetical protein A2U01_0075621, partial [Trifolium medium]|nr:hypothetical protein [Trifolium medium]